MFNLRTPFSCRKICTRDFPPPAEGPLTRQGARVLVYVRGNRCWGLDRERIKTIARDLNCFMILSRGVWPPNGAELTLQ